MRIARWLIEGGKALVELGDHFFMQQARLDSLGARKEPPKEKGEYTEVVVDALIASRAESSDEDWLRMGGRRDQECVRYGITREQVAGILAAGTKREKKNGSGNVSVSVVPPAEDRTVSTLSSPVAKTGEKNERNMFDAKEWGEVTLEPNGSRDQIPLKPFRDATEDDKKIVVLVYVQCKAHEKDWGEMRQQLCCTRRLTRQQVAAIVAEHTRQENKKFASQAAHA